MSVLMSFESNKLFLSHALLERKKVYLPVPDGVILNSNARIRFKMLYVSVFWSFGLQYTNMYLLVNSIVKNAHT